MTNRIRKFFAALCALTLLISCAFASGVEEANVPAAEAEDLNPEEISEIIENAGEEEQLAAPANEQQADEEPTDEKPAEAVQEANGTEVVVSDVKTLSDEIGQAENQQQEEGCADEESAEPESEPEEEKILSLKDGSPKSIKGKVSPESPCIVKAADDFSRTVLFTLTVPAENSVSVTLNNQVLSLTRADAEDEIRYTFTQKLNKDQITAFTLTANGEAGASFTLAISRMPKEEETEDPETEIAENTETAEESLEEKLAEEAAETIENEVNEEPAEESEEEKQAEEETAEESAKESEEKLTEESEEQAAEEPAEKPEEEQQTEEETAEESAKESEEKLTEESEEELPAEESTEETEKTAEESAEESIGEETAEEKQQDEESEEETVKEPIDKETGKESAEGEEQEAETAEKETEEPSGQPATEAAEEESVIPAEDPEEAPGEEQQDAEPAGNEEESAVDTADEEIGNVPAEEQQEEKLAEEAAGAETEESVEKEATEEYTEESEEPSILFTISFNDGEYGIGYVAHFTATLEGFEGLTYTLQWQQNKGDGVWENIEGQTGENMDLLITEENCTYTWRVKAFYDLTDK